MRVSTHAPAWGATRPGRYCQKLLLPFQLTRPRGARPLLQQVFSYLITSFNSRARVGRD